MSFSQEELLYARGRLLEEFGAEIGVHRSPHEVDSAFRNRIYHVKYPISSKIEAGRLVMSEMTLRDYFAAKAMAGRCAIPGDFEEKFEAEFCYKLADAMLAARGESK